jgi:hypothetical protein
MRLIRMIAALGLGALCWASPGLAASPEGEGSIFAPLRYNDDVSRIRSATGAQDFWNPVKRVDLSADPAVWLSLGGELRERWETSVNPSFGIKAPSSNGYVLHRLGLFGDLHLGEALRVFVDLGDALRFGRRNVASTTDVDRLDVHQAFVDYTVPGTPIRVRAGREEMSFGWQRLIALREGPNVRRAFDGGRVSARVGDVVVDVFGVRPVNNHTGYFDDTVSRTQSLWGVYVTTPVVGPLQADVYALGYENTAAKYRGLTGSERRLTGGVRLFGRTPDYDWNIEAVKQGGTYRNLTIDAWMLAAVTGVSFRALPWSPRLGLEGNVVSGDTGGRRPLGTFNAMFPRLPYFAETSLLVPSNLYDLRPTVTFSPIEDVSVVVGWDVLWRKSARDGLYSSGQVLITGTNKSPGSRVGNEASFDARWRVDDHLTLGGIYAHFNAGPVLKSAGGRDVDFMVGFATYKF